MGKEVQLGIRIKVDAPTAVPDIERIESAGTKMARELGKAGKAMATELDGGTAAVTKNAAATATMAETEAAATARIREMVAASLQKNSSVTDSARSLDAAAASTRRATEENTSLTRSLERMTAQSARPVATGSVGTSSEEATKYVASLQRQYDMLGKNSSELAQYEARMLGGTKATQQQAAALASNASALQARIAAEQRTGQAADAFIAKLKEQNATLGMNRTQLLTYQAAQLGVSNEAAPMIARLKEASEAAKGHGASIDGATKATHQFGFQTAQSKKELLVLTHELSQGRFNAFGGSLMVLAEQTGAASFLFSAAGLSILAVVAAIAVLATAVVKGTMEVRTLNHDLLVTGNYAGVSAGGILNLSASISEVTHNAGKATDILTGLTASGRFTGDAFVLTGEAAAFMAKLTGDSAKTVVKEFERMDQGVEKFAFEFDKKYHMIGTAILENISMLEKSQQKQEAESLAAGTIAEVAKERLVTMREHLTDGQKAWTDLGDSALAAWDKMKKASAIAVASAPVEAEIAWRKSWKAGDMTAATFAGSWRDTFSGANNDAEIAKLESKLVQMKKQDEVQTALVAIQEKGNAALLAIETETKKYEKGEKKAREFMRIKQQFLDLLAANPDSKWLKGVTVSADKTQVNGGAYDELIASIEQRYKPKTQAGSDPRKAELDGDIKAAQATTAVEKEKYEQLNRLASMYHAAGQQSDEAFFNAKRANTLAIGTAEINGYASQLDALQAFHGKTAVERQENANKIEANEAAMIAAAQRNADQIEVIDEQERLRKIGVQTASDAAKNKYLSDLEEEARQLEESNRARETSRAAVERETVARLDLAIAYQKQFMEGQATSGATAEEIAQAPAILKYLEDQRAARLRLVQGFEQQESDKYTTKLANQAIKDWERAGNSIADSLSTAFGTGGKAIGQMFKAYSEGTAAQLRAQQQLAEAKKKSDSNPDKIREINQAQLAGSTAQLKSYADMTGAAQGFFEEGSKGYKAMGAAVQVLHAAEVALTVVKGINAVLTQGAGDPYTAFVRMAAMAAIVVGLGVAISGGGNSGANVAQERQAANGTGTVLGDPTAKSESISKSLAQIADNTYRGLSISGGMLAALRNIESGIGGLGGLLAQTPGVTNTLGPTTQSGLANFSAKTLSTFPLTAIVDKLTGGFLSKVSNSVINGIFGGKVTTLDTGITAGKLTLDKVAKDGLTVGQFTDIKKDGGLFSKDKYSSPVTLLGEEMDDQFTKIVLGLRDTISSAAVALGVGGDAFSARLNAFVVDIGKVSFKGLDAEAQQKALEAAFSKMGDDMAKFGVDGLRDFRAAGEGYLQTLVRVANDYATVDAVLSSLGKTFGTVGLASISAREELIKLSGGLDNFTSQGAFFLENFFTDAEKAATLRTAVNARITPINNGVEVTTTEQYKALAMAQDLTTDSGRKAYATLMATAEAFKQLVGYGNAAGRTIADISSQRADLQKQIDELTMTSLQLRAKERQSIDASNLALFDELTSRRDIAAAYATESEALKSTIERLKSFAAGIQTFKDSLQLGTLSTLTPVQKMMEAQRQYEETLAKARAGDTTAQAALTAAASAYLSADQIVKASSDAYAADVTRVQSDLAALAALAGTQKTEAEKQLSVLDQQVGQLVTLNNTTVAMKDAIIALGQALVAGGKANITVGMLDGSHASGLANVPFDGYRAELHQGEIVMDAQAAVVMRRYFGAASRASSGNNDAMVAEMKALREALSEEFKGLRADQERQTGDVLELTAEAHRGTADAIVSGTERALDRAAYNQQTKQRGIPA